MADICSGLSILGEFDGEVSTPKKSITIAEKCQILLSDHTPFYDNEGLPEPWKSLGWHWADIHYAAIDVFEGVI
jgi:hypothetical protein